MELSAAERRRRECGWRVSVPVDQQRIPSYDNFSDRPSSGYDNFNRHMGGGTTRDGTSSQRGKRNKNRGNKSRGGGMGHNNNNNNNNNNGGLGNSNGGIGGNGGSSSSSMGGGNGGRGGNSLPRHSSSVSQTIFKELQRKNMSLGKPNIMQSPPRSLSGMTSSNPGPSFDFAPAHFRVDSVARDKATKHSELEVLKLVLIREGYVRRLADVSRQIIDGDRTILRAAGGTFIVDLLVQTRASSLAVVKAVVAWRSTLTRTLIERLTKKNGTMKGTKKNHVLSLSKKQQNDIALARCEPFVWNGINYLLKMCHDTDFLAGTSPLVQVRVLLKEPPFCFVLGVFFFCVFYKWFHFLIFIFSPLFLSPAPNLDSR